MQWEPLHYADHRRKIDWCLLVWHKLRSLQSMFGLCVGGLCGCWSWQLGSFFFISQRCSDKKDTPPSCRGDRCTPHIVCLTTGPYTMSCDQCYPLPQVFLVDGGGGSQDSAQPPSLVPCWSFPPAQQGVRSREKSRGTMVVSFGGALIVLMLFLLVFAALGFGAYQIYNMQKELKKMKEVRSHWVWWIWKRATELISTNNDWTNDWLKVAKK